MGHFGPHTVVRVGGGSAAGDTGSVYARADTGYATPLSCVQGGSTVTTLTVGAQSTLEFDCAGQTAVVWKSGTGPAVLLEAVDGTAAALDVGTTTGTVMAGDDARVVAADAGEASTVTVVAATGAACDIVGPIGRYTMDQSCSFSLPAPTEDGAVRVAIISGAYSPSFPGVLWPDSGAPPTYGTPAIYTFVTADGGANWYGAHGGSAFA